MAASKHHLLFLALILNPLLTLASPAPNPNAGVDYYNPPPPPTPTTADPYNPFAPLFTMPEIPTNFPWISSETAGYGDLPTLPVTKDPTITIVSTATIPKVASTALGVLTTPIPPPPIPTTCVSLGLSTLIGNSIQTLTHTSLITTVLTSVYTVQTSVQITNIQTLTSAFPCVSGVKVASTALGVLTTPPALPSVSVTVPVSLPGGGGIGVTVPGGPGVTVGPSGVGVSPGSATIGLPLPPPPTGLPVVTGTGGGVPVPTNYIPPPPLPSYAPRAVKTKRNPQPNPSIPHTARQYLHSLLAKRYPQDAEQWGLELECIFNGVCTSGSSPILDGANPGTWPNPGEAALNGGLGGSGGTDVPPSEPGDDGIPTPPPPTMMRRRQVSAAVVPDSGVGGGGTGLMTEEPAVALNSGVDLPLTAEGTPVVEMGYGGGGGQYRRDGLCKRGVKGRKSVEWC